MLIPLLLGDPCPSLGLNFSMCTTKIVILVLVSHRNVVKIKDETQTTYYINSRQDWSVRGELWFSAKQPGPGFFRGMAGHFHYLWGPAQGLFLSSSCSLMLWGSENVNY